jgi:hemerythrin
MAVINWSEWYEVGIPSLDHRHWGLFEALNRVQEAIQSDGAGVRIAQTLDALLGDILTHLRDEETLMLAVDHPGAPECLAEHNRFLAQVAEYRAQYKTNPSEAKATELTMVLADWLMNHLTRLDIQFVNAIKEKVEDRWAEVWCY